MLQVRVQEGAVAALVVLAGLVVELALVEAVSS